jgi:hypothetical protein
MSKMSDQIDEKVNQSVANIELRAYKKSCRTGLVAVGFIVGGIAKYVTDHSTNVFNALYVLFYGKMP